MSELESTRIGGVPPGDRARASSRGADPSRSGTDVLLDVRNVKVDFNTENGVVHAVDDVSFSLAPGEVLAVVGESGSGKSVTAMTLMGLTRSPNAVFGGSARLHDLDLISASGNELRRVRGKEIAMIFQDPMTSLNPVHRIGKQIVEQIQAHEDVSDEQAMRRAVQVLERVGIPRAQERAASYPHEFSGGMRQRVMIAMAMACDPAILIADEPTTALDVTIQAQILEEMRALRDRSETAIILVTHDLGVVADIADRIAVMYAGRIVEMGTLDEIFYDPQHPYTWGLLGSIARIDRDRPGRLPSIPGMPPSLINRPQGCHFRPRCRHEFEACPRYPELESRLGEAPGHHDRCWLSAEEKRTRRVVGEGERDRARSRRCGGVTALLEVAHVKQHFPVRRGVFNRVSGHVHAVDDVSFSLGRGETLGLVGESGCGKTTLSRTIMRLLEPTDGTIELEGRDISHARSRELRPLRKDVQMVFQDPFASLNPRKRIVQIVGAPLMHHGVPRQEIGRRTNELLTRVGLSPEHANRFPHEFSAGQRQRIGIARALALSPKLIVLDEPVSALDVSIQAQVVNLLEDIQEELGVAYLFVAHDLSVVRHVSDRIAVMYLGRVMELSPSEELYSKPIHPYTAALLSAIPVPDPRANRDRRRVVVGGEPPSPIDPPSGCVFRTRCPRARELCRNEVPRLSEYPGGHVAACHFPLNVSEVEVGCAGKSPLSTRDSGNTAPALVEDDEMPLDTGALA